MRPNYQAGALLSARDLNDEQDYCRNRLRLHDRFVHGSGIVCGLRVYAAPERGHPWMVAICPGYAVAPCGDEIEVPTRVLVDIRDFHWSRPLVNGVPARAAFVGMRYAGGEVSAAAYAGAGCGCGCTSHTGESAGRLHDGCAIDIVWTFHPETRTFDLCAGGPTPCPAPLNGAYVILAAVRLPVSESSPLNDRDVLVI